MTGALPFDDDDEASIIRRIRDEPHKPPSLLNAGLDHAFDGIIEIALAKSPQKRFGSVRAFAQQLLEWARHNHIEVTQSALSDFVSTLFAQERRERLMDLETISVTASSQSVSEYTRIVGTGYDVSQVYLTDDEETS